MTPKIRSTLPADIGPADECSYSKAGNLECEKLRPDNGNRGKCLGGQRTRITRCEDRGCVHNIDNNYDAGDSTHENGIKESGTHGEGSL